MRFLPMFASRRQTMASDRSYTSTGSGFTSDSFTSSLFSKPSLQWNLSNSQWSTHSSTESESIGIAENVYSLSRLQLDILQPPSQLFSPSKSGTIPYAINSKDWHQENYGTSGHYRKPIEDNWNSVYGTAGVVYGIAKVFIALCHSFRVDLHTPAGSILTFLERAEQELRHGSAADFVFAIENLYFSLYARLEIEIALLHFCSSFIDTRRKPAKRNRDLTQIDLNHVYTILNVCKNVLDEKSICSAFDERLVRFYKRCYVAEMTRRYKIDGRLPLDPSGYRAHVNDTVKNPESLAYRHWCQMYPELQELSIDILAFLSEKYLPIYPRTVHKQNEYTFKMHNTKFADTWEKNMVCAHRLCSLARIEGKAVGELRREEEAFSIRRYASEQKCICLDICACSRLCTRSGSTLCPCSGRWVRGILTQLPESRASFRDKSTIMSELTYESLAALKSELPDDLVQRELLGGINLIREEMIKQRLATTTHQMEEISEVDIVFVR